MKRLIRYMYKSSIIPLSLYIHIPWCVKKCPYCDFNSHAQNGALPEKEYIERLLQDLRQELLRFPELSDRPLHSIFLGGGTPSLLSGGGIDRLLRGIESLCRLEEAIEITLEANPGTVEQGKFAEFKAAGINRISLGVQSFQSEQLHRLGRIHQGTEAINAVLAAQAVGFKRINLDLMYGLPKQTVSDALADLKTALQLQPTHLSWYQLTLEPNTAFYHRPPPLPTEKILWEIQTQGQAYLADQGVHPYEISAYTVPNGGEPCRHNLNYWRFGDYIGIGAGAHGKISRIEEGQLQIIRRWKVRHPKAYLRPDCDVLGEETQVSRQALPFEFFLNYFRVYEAVPVAHFEARTGMPIAAVYPKLNQAQARGLLEYDAVSIRTTERGKRYLNDLLEIFL